MFQDGAVGLLARGIGRRRKATVHGAIFGWVYIRWAARKNKGIQTGQRLGQFLAIAERQ